MTFCLETKIIEPDNNEKIDNAVILLHGYGGDGTDISMLTLNWKRFLNNTIFLCPNGHQRCSINPSGYQWFDLSIDDEKYITAEAVKAEIILKTIASLTFFIIGLRLLFNSFSLNKINNDNNN